MPQAIENKVNGFDDTEIDQLEDLRRYGHANRRISDEGDYYTLPPKRTDMMQDWRTWRTQINDVMADLVGKKSTNRDTLTVDALMKTPDFFKGTMSIHGQRIKDEYGGKPITETDDQGVRVEKKIMDENFFLFGIPRISLKRTPNKTGNVIQRQNKLPHPGLPRNGRRFSMANAQENPRRIVVNDKTSLQQRRKSMPFF